MSVLTGRFPLTRAGRSTLTRRFAAALSHHRERAGWRYRADWIPAYAGRAVISAAGRIRLGAIIVGIPRKEGTPAGSSADNHILPAWLQVHLQFGLERGEFAQEFALRSERAVDGDQTGNREAGLAGGEDLLAQHRGR